MQINPQTDLATLLDIKGLIGFIYLFLRLICKCLFTNRGIGSAALCSGF